MIGKRGDEAPLILIPLFIFFNFLKKLVKHYEYKRISIGGDKMGKDYFKWVAKGGGIKSYEEFQIK
jgi:hypothetical protein